MEYDVPITDEKNKVMFSIIDKHQHMHFFTFNTVLV